MAAAPAPAPAPVQRPPSGQLNSIAASAVRDPIPSRRPSSATRASVTKFSYVEEPTEEAYDDEAGFNSEGQPVPAGRLRRQRAKRIRLAIVAALVLVAGAAAFWWKTHQAPTPILADGQTFLIGPVQNKTADETLNGAVNEGLAIQLRQSHLLNIRSIVAYESGLRLLGTTDPETTDPSLPQKIAQRVGASAYLTGDISGTGPYTLSLALLNTDTNQKIAAIDDTAGSREQLADMITRAADLIRSDMGEAGDAISKSDVPLRRNGTADIDALHAVALAEAATPGGHWLDAIAYYQKAAALEPKFAQAQIGLAWAYRREHAEAAAADAARAAQAAVQDASERTRMLAQYAYEINASGDYTRALAVIRDFNKQFPQDPEGLEDLARVLRLEGHLPEALQDAQSAIEKDPFRVDAYNQAETILLDMDRYDASLQVAAAAQRSGLVHAGSHLLAAYLVGQPDSQIQDFWRSQSNTLTLLQGAAYATYLDNTGQMNAGRNIWQSTAAKAVITRGLESSAAYLLAQGALNRALATDCAPALDMARLSAAQPQGITAVFNAGMAQALCGDTSSAQHAISTLTQTYPQSTAAIGYYLPDLKAAVALHANDPVAALDALKNARVNDLISLTPYLRGLAHISTRDTKLGLVDFQMVLAHRGSSVAALDDAYPMAQLGLARAFSQSGDTGNGSRSYKTFLDLWKLADPQEPALAEARAKAH
jgi:tetratricopeptide (TPR) repeat protein